MMAYSAYNFLSAELEEKQYDRDEARRREEETLPTEPVPRGLLSVPLKCTTTAGEIGRKVAKYGTVEGEARRVPDVDESTDRRDSLDRDPMQKIQDLFVEAAARIRNERPNI